MLPGGDEDVAGGYGEDVEKGHDVWGGEEEVALRIDLLGVRGGGDRCGGFGRVGFGDFAEGAGNGVVVVYGRHVCRGVGINDDVQGYSRVSGRRVALDRGDGVDGPEAEVEWRLRT